ncbi:YheC/YheD family protein [Hazenella coriacea]|uniref:YheC/D-like protein n=1 Tax=Hazenella coriacea TaxID=1179467 RepID=A0A4R3LGY2_9BACL|nr:YheC/YheD family protein [Hazenella coriacea]TCS96776.1 YheC/D-like protein [Hazenella coriacea]
MIQQQYPHFLGIITSYHNHKKRPPFLEASYFHQLAIVGKELGIDIIVFNPKEVRWSNRKVPGWTVDKKGSWEKDVFPVPYLIYDRCYYLDQKHYQELKPFVQRIADDPNTRLLGRALKGKYQTFEILKKNPEILPYLPETTRYQKPSDVSHILNHQTTVLLKPNGGSHGRGVVAISKVPKGFLIQGRSKNNQSFKILVRSNTKLQQWIGQFTQGSRYLIQPFLQLTTLDHKPFDLRILVQKNNRREWETTGIAVRMGQPHTITSNLHGGGEAAMLHPFLEKNFPQESRFDILQKITWISKNVPPFIEKEHGPLVELGIDVGIDREANVWILEVNSKPGRTIFIKTGELGVRQRAVQLPMQYARSLLMGT